MPQFEGDAAEAEADLRRAMDAASRAEDALTAAEGRVEAIADLDVTDVRGGEEQISQMMAAAEAEVETLREVFLDAEEEVSRTTQHWIHEGYLDA